MIVMTRTPLRVSLFGGGTDYPAYFRRMPGSVIGFAINKYIHISALSLGAFVDYRYRLSYSRVEMVDEIGSFQHPVVRTLLRHYQYDKPTDFSVQADMPASAGLGSSSSFTVGFIHLLSTLMGRPRLRMEMAREAIHAEQVLLGENVGVQDQLHATFGSINRFNFSGDDYSIAPINISGAALKSLTDWMILIYTGIKRHASEVVKEQIAKTAASKVDKELSSLIALVDEAHKVLENKNNATPAIEIARILEELWQLKKRLSSGVTMPEIEELYDLCRSNGGLGGKLCGAGGGGFLLIVVPPEKRAHLVNTVGARRCVEFEVDLNGTTLIGAAPAESFSDTFRQGDLR